MKFSVMRKVLGAVVLAYGCGGSNQPSAPPEMAIVSGIVREQGSDAPVAGATISGGGRSAISAQNGQFELGKVPVGGPLELTARAPGFGAYAERLTVNAGANIITIRLEPNGLYEVSSYVLFLSPNVARYRGVLVVMFGGTVDTRPLLRGDLKYYQAFPLSGDVAGYLQSVRMFADNHEFAVMGGTFESTADTYSGIFNSLLMVATQSGHPELSDAPLLLHGHSARACVANDFAVAHPQQIIGFISTKGPCVFGAPAVAAAVPAYFVYGQSDPTVSAEVASQMRAVVEQNRTRGALWAFAVEPGAGHAQVGNHSLLFNWMSAVARLRLASETSAALRPVNETEGWLGDGASFQTAAYPCFTGNKATASWLPSEQSARDWQSLSSDGNVATVIACSGANQFGARAWPLLAP